MKGILFSILSVLLFWACSKPEKVEPYEYPSCKGTIVYKRDTVAIEKDTMENSWFHRDSSMYYASGGYAYSTRLDIRVTEKKTGNILVLTLRDTTNQAVMPIRIYDDRFTTIKYYLKDYDTSGFKIDQVRVELTDFNKFFGTCSGKFQGRMINASKGDTVQLRMGEFKNICINQLDSL